MRADATEQGSRRSGQAIVGADLDQGGFLEASPAAGVRTHAAETEQG
jgi:hypothetical protein